MNYVSTRGGQSPAPFREILLGGLAPDGGLVVPEHYSTIDAARLADYRSMDYRAIAFDVLARYMTDIDPDMLRTLIDRAYNADVFGSDDIAPVTELGRNLYLLELSNGPTLAFKDMAMQLLGHLFEHVLSETGGRLNILGATSGDTGSAAEHAMRGKAGVNVFMLSPHGKMSPFQAAQMYSLDDANIHNVAIRGVFDDCQDLVKTVNSDAQFKSRFSIGAVNSINWARVAAQVVYYAWGWSRVAKSPDDEVAFSVPSGNFGNIYAGHIARQMGVPIRRLVLATNENDVLDEFFRTGVYNVRPAADVHKTSSPSMDISKASNFERFIFDLLGRDPQRMAAAWNGVLKDGRLDLSTSDAWKNIGDYGFISGRSTHDDRLKTIREIRDRYGRVVDPHTADGLKVGREQAPADLPLICLETALPAKFEATIVEALGERPPRPAGYEGLEARAQHVDVMDPTADSLKSYIEARAA